MDTLRSKFSGHEALFRGLDIHWDRDQSVVAHPVVRLRFDGKYNDPQDLERSTHSQLKTTERNARIPGVFCRTGHERQWDLLDRLLSPTGLQAVVLADEYDKPILDVLQDPDLAIANRTTRAFLWHHQERAEHVRFAFITGVKMFSKASLFLGLNNLTYIGLDPCLSPPDQLWVLASLGWPGRCDCCLGGWTRHRPRWSQPLRPVAVEFAAGQDLVTAGIGGLVGVGPLVAEVPQRRIVIAGSVKA